MNKKNKKNKKKLFLTHTPVASETAMCADLFFRCGQLGNFVFQLSTNLIKRPKTKAGISSVSKV